MSEGGIEKLKNLLVSPLPYDCIKRLARQVIANCCQDTADCQINESSSLEFKDALDG